MADDTPYQCAAAGCAIRFGEAFASPVDNGSHPRHKVMTALTEAHVFCIKHTIAAAEAMTRVSLLPPEED